MTQLYPRETRNLIHTKTLMQMFIVTLLVIFQSWKEPKCPTAEECINIQWYIHTMNYYSATIAK